MRYDRLLLLPYLTVCKNSAFGSCFFVPIVLYSGSSQVKQEFAPGIKRFLFVRTEWSNWKRSNAMTLGPLEYLAIGFEGNRFTGQQPAPPPSGGLTDEKLEQLKQPGALRESEILTDAEFDAQK